jgi:hypothetical protein
VRHVRMLGLCLVAALALGAYAVSSASALEWGKCEFVGPGGNYNESSPGSGTSNCSKSEKAKPKGTGEYEWRKATEVAEKRVAEGKSANVPFSGHNVGTGGVLSTSSQHCEGGTYGEHVVTRAGCIEGGGTPENSEGLSVECTAENNSGEAVAKNKVENIHVTFTGCVVFGSLPCESEGAAEGEISTNTLKGKLGWINKSTKEVGVLLEPAQKHGLFARFACIGILETLVGVGNKKEGAFYVKGTNYPSGCGGECPGATPEEEKHGGYDGVISPITPVNQMTGEFEQVYSTNHSLLEPQNIPSSFEGKHIDLLEDRVQCAVGAEEQCGKESIMWSAASEEITNVNTSEEEAEIKA